MLLLYFKPLTEEHTCQAKMAPVVNEILSSSKEKYFVSVGFAVPNRAVTKEIVGEKGLKVYVYKNNGTGK